ncbi:LamG-like jellyroll fold domain-containing protein [Asticcacaulis machinosus]|uniref:Staphylococcus aureus surface protein A n=1 Tax=Asticcacaulis machinosus TaxID=2984211 RepID=A0ABT5HGJ2_9CAUL|nr:LamG-like jellyroll fold domain-containing protein [Asticcacaulis machinosus]MDC7675375.1 hypothetical protein [Asticcacaulis machinosus]
MDLVARVIAGFQRVAAEIKAVKAAGQGKTLGQPGVGKTLQAILPDGVIYADIQWRRDGAEIFGATAPMYLQVAEDANCDIDWTYENVIWAAPKVAVPEIYLLGPINPTSASIILSAEQGAVIFNITGVEPGATPAFMPNDGRFIVGGDEVNGWKLLRGTSAVSAGEIVGAIVKSHPNASNSPYSTPVTVSVTTGRIPEIDTIYGGRAAPVPQSYYDFVQRDANDPNTHPTLGASTHYAVKNGRWSDGTTWNTGTVPGENAIVRTMTYEVIYDVESDVKIKDLCVCNGGTLKWDITKDTRLWVDTIISHGVFWMGDTTSPVPESTTAGKPRTEIVFWQSEAPGATARLGLNTMGPTRIHGAAKAARLTCNGNMAVGATSVVLEGVATANWKIGDKILFVATTLSGTTTNDPQYTGPTQAYLPYEGSDAVRQNNAGFKLSHDEVRTITNISGNTVTFDSALTYPHNRYTDVLDHGEVVVIKPLVANLSRSIRWRSAETTPRQKRAHSMFMHCDDQDIRFVETLNMGRTDTDPSLATPDGRLIYTTAAQTVSVTDPVNVRGRYALHIHWTGAYLGRRQVVMLGCVAWAPAGEVPIPGWGITHHASRAAIEECLVFNVRGAGIVTELGNEIGQWLNNLVCWARGDGYPIGWGDRSEFYTNHNGHVGNAYECQARQVLCQGNKFSSCNYGWIYHQQIEYHNAALIALRTPIDTSLRLFDPISQGGDAGNQYRDDNTYGLRTAQIPDWHDNGGWNAKVGFFVAHRGPERQDAIPMVARGFHCVNVSNPFHLHNYSNSYYFYDFLWVNDTKGGVGGVIGTVSWRFMFVNYKIKNFSVGFQDIGGGALNYDGFWIDGLFDNVDTHFLNKWDGLYMNAATHHQKDVMGPWVISGTDPKAVIARTWANITRADLPQPYPLEPYGRKLGSSYPAVAPGDTPYFVLGDGLTTNGIDLTVQAGGITGQIAIFGVIRDCVGDRRYPDHQGLDTGGVGLSIRGARTGPTLTGEALVLRNGCFNDNGTWKSRLWFPDVERYNGHYFQFPVDVTLTGFSGSFLATNTVNPNVKPQLSVLPEYIPGRQLVADTNPPVLQLSNLIEPELRPLALPLRANKAPIFWTVDGGTDAAMFTVTDQRQLDWAGGVKSAFAPQDADGNNSYNVTLKGKDLYGNVSTAAISVTLRQVFVSDSFTDAAGTTLLAHTGERGAGWIAHPASPDSTTNPSVITAVGKLIHPHTTGGYYLASGVPSSANHYVELDIDYLSHQQGSEGIMLRFNETAMTGYLITIAHEEEFKKIKIFRMSAGTWNYLIEKTFIWDAKTSKRFRGSINGSNITVTIDGEEFLTRSDGTVTAAGRVGLYRGRAGIQTDAIGFQLNAYRAGLISPPAAPVNTTLPGVTGSNTVGATRTASNGVWSNSPTGYSIQWYRGNAPIEGANGATYTLVQADYGKIVRPRVTAHNADGGATAIYADVTEPVAGVAWAPADWTKVAWYDAQDNTTIFSNTGGTTAAVAGADRVRLWRDKSGNNNHLSEAGNYPSYVIDSINGKKAVKFTASATERLTSTASSIINAATGDDNGYSVVMAVRRGAGGSSGTLLAWCMSSNGDYFSTHLMNANNGLSVVRKAGGGTTKSAISPVNVFDQDAWDIVTIVVSGTTADVWVNGAQVVTAADVNVPTLGTNANRFVIGSIWDWSWNSAFNGEIGEIMISNDTARNANHFGAEIYMAERHGVTLG